MSRRPTAALLTAALLAAACAHRGRRLKPQDGDLDAVIGPLAPPDPSRSPDGGRGSARRGAAADLSRPALAAPRAPHQRLGENGFDEPPMGESRETLARPAPVDWSPPQEGDKPGEGAPQGRPAARRPDELAALPTDGQPRYFSPKALSKRAIKHKIPAPLDRSRSAEASGPAPQGEAARAEFAPAPTAALSDQVPDAMVEDPKALGSYHVQVSTDPAFGSRVLDRVYPFMVDPDLDADLEAIGAKRGVYYVRYSIVDLLEFEHPFSAPQRLVYTPR